MTNGCSMSGILVTAFGPFGGDTINPTENVLGMLPDEIRGHTIHKLVLPVEFGRSAEIAIAEYGKLRPAAVIMLGQAGGRSAITPETTARNIMSSKEPDNAGYIPGHMPTPDNSERIPGHVLISENEPDTLSSTLPIDAIIDAVIARGIRCEKSDDAGAYVCNALFYNMLEHNMGEIPTGFIHVPFIKEQGHADKPFMELSDIRTAVETIIETVIEFIA